MDYLYKTVLKRARIEYVVERSRFIATVLPCESREEVDSFFNEIRQEFKDATHNVPAFVLGNKMELKWASDDGEPQGTSGPPILKVLEGKGLTNLALVVTRYFGGIKLGTGGLVRAYSQSAEEVIREAGIAGAAIFLKYKVSDPVLYGALYDNITIESLFPRYVLCKYYGSSYESDTITAMRKSFKSDCVRLGNVYEKEHESLEGLYLVWGV